MTTITAIDHFLACSMCLGGASGEIAIAANMAIGLMLTLLVFVLGSFAWFIVVLARGEKAAIAEDQALANVEADRPNVEF